MLQTLVEYLFYDYRKVPHLVPGQNKHENTKTGWSFAGVKQRKWSADKQSYR